MQGRWAVAWGVATLVAASFLIPAVASASAGGITGAATTAPPSSSSPSPSLLWPCYDPRTLPPSRPPLTPPTAPGTPQVVSVANNYVHLRWAAASDADGLACYQVFEDRGGVKTKVATFGPDVTDGSFYVDYPPYGTASRVATLYVVAVDRWGADSAPSGSVNVTIHNDVVSSPSPSSSYWGACHVTYNSYDWFGGMTSYVSITNTGSTTIAGWWLTFAFPDPGQRVTSGWSAEWSQNGSTVTATALPWNRDLAPGDSVSIGFTGTNQGVNPAPSAWRLNGATCR
ncbi:cellulose binding domain-containing protein [Microbispora sp. RL4-1S]|uniref:Cellulose binding domain-containing protein n=1 Tax=Microbispora oryzae TaxID=2806554 RepID=A0A941ALI1_9ACTN|nr:cellulose binding domain-containing protein [Microbispora oryzae]MBP2708176.1 cellulose binding domain-containing protein [Microbispora oryzae]